MILQALEEECSGCLACELVCSLVLFKELNPRKAAIRIRGEFPAPGAYRIACCDQCGDCAAACPHQAIYRKASGYWIDPDKCRLPCTLCADACPRDAIFFHADVPHAIKCVSCGQCVRYCPTRALVDKDGKVENMAPVWRNAR